MQTILRQYGEWDTNLKQMKNKKEKLSNKDVKFSIKTKLICVMAGLIIGIFLTYLIVNAFFLEKFYINSKKNAILSAYNDIDVLITGDKVTSDDMEQIGNICAKTGLTTLITKNSGDILFTYGNKDLLEYRLENAIFDPNTPGVNVDILKKTNRFVLQKIETQTDNSEYLEMWGVYSNGDIFIMRMAVANIKESVNIFNHFLIYAASAVMILTLFIASFVSRKFTKPLLELTSISEKMLRLDFDVHYSGDSQDEINVLGNTMNELSNKLESTITELKQANNELKTDIAKKVEIDEMRKDFISNVSHELKTPIALIQGYAEGLKENVNDDDESRDFYCDVIMDEASKMNTMVKKLLTLNQLEFGNSQLQLERFDIVAVINGVLNKLNLMIEQNNAQLKLDTEESVYVWADEFQIEEVITNYLTNAINHLDNERVITIRIKINNNVVRVMVHNTGNNIPEKDLKNIWIKFYKVDKARTREYGGSGIGLSIVKAVLEAHNHDCGVNNTDNGVEFWFELDSGII